MTEEEYKILRAELCDLDVLLMRNECKMIQIMEKYETEKKILSDDNDKICGKIRAIRIEIKKGIDNNLKKEEENADSKPN
jgi:hypothetical protein